MLLSSLLFSLHDFCKKCVLTAASAIDYKFQLHFTFVEEWHVVSGLGHLQKVWL